MCLGVPARKSLSEAAVKSFVAVPVLTNSFASVMLSSPNPFGRDICPGSILSEISTRTLTDPLGVLNVVLSPVSIFRSRASSGDILRDPPMSFLRHSLPLRIVFAVYGRRSPADKTSGKSLFVMLVGPSASRSISGIMPDNSQ